jgi:hypothetical protein
VDARVVLFDQVCQGGRCAVRVEGAPTIRQQDQRSAAPAEGSVDLGDEPDRLGEMLKDVRADDEVLALIAKSRESIRVKVSDDVRSRKLTIGELGEQPTILVRLPAIHVGDTEPGRRLEGNVTRTKLDTSTVKVGGEALARTRSHERFSIRLRAFGLGWRRACSDGE